MISIDELTIDQVHIAFKSGEFTARDLVEAYLERIKAFDKIGPKLNAITAISTVALEEADVLDAYYAKHGLFAGPLHGVPVIVKDQADTKGIQTAYGNICCKHIPEEDAFLVTKLKEAGAIILAKSSMPDFAASYSSTSSLSGETLNPYDTTRETGGSSAGTGAAIAANYGLIGVGEDTGGSIRVPASFCNLVGVRPTVGLVSRQGLSALVKSQDTPGPMTRTVRDAALMLDVLAGYDPRDAYTTNAWIAGPPRGESYASNLSEGSMSKARIGVLNSVFGADSDPECASVNKVIRKALSEFKAEKTTLIDVDIPNLEHYISFTAVFMSRSRFDIENFLASHPILADKGVTLDKIHAAHKYHPSLPLLEKLGTAVSHPYCDKEYVKRLDEQAEFQRLVVGIMAEKKLDAIVYPSVKIAAPTVEDVLGTRFEKSFPTNTTIGSHLRQPAISVPVGFTENGLPVGLEMLGIPYSEQKLLELAYGVESIMKARKAPAL